MTKARCILLNGFAGAGKSTIAKRYKEEHPMALVIEGDELIVNIGQWTTHEAAARKQVFELTKAMTATHLAAGYDVVLPYLVMDASHTVVFEAIAHAANAEFYEIVLHNDRHDAIARLMKRGTWGEAGLPPITNDELPQIEKDIDRMQAELEKRPEARVIRVVEGDTDGTYREFQQILTN